MEELSVNSKLGQHFIKAYNRSTWHTLKDVYAKPSEAKQEAFRRCQWQYRVENGDRLRIIGANCQAFTVAFMVRTTFGITGLHVITRCHDYFIVFENKL